MKNSYTQKEQYYNDYLALDKILDAQFPESKARGVDAHDEMLFIVIHQAYELWFKQIMYELNSIIDHFQEDRINDNSAALQTVSRHLNRIVEIWKLLVDQIGILDTMTPMDFLDFRDLLTPASGFQSYQFRILETKLGLKMEARHQKKYYQSQLRAEHIEGIRKVEEENSLFELVDQWLARIPFWDIDKYWSNFEVPTDADQDLHPFWAKYKHTYQSGLKGNETSSIDMSDFDLMFFGGENRQTRLSPASCRAVLFINLYRDYPLLQLPFQLLGKLLELDELMATWRYRHVAMVHRMIGMRSGTGGSSGAAYLRGAMEKHNIFNNLASLTTYLVPRQKLPKLPEVLVERLGFKEI
jgi:tryptophan 2,3-dioxygenase